eukprot:6459446-Amphidinium_carterae.1
MKTHSVRVQPARTPQIVTESGESDRRYDGDCIFTYQEPVVQDVAMDTVVQMEDAWHAPPSHVHRIESRPYSQLTFFLPSDSCTTWPLPSAPSSLGKCPKETFLAAPRQVQASSTTIRSGLLTNLSVFLKSEGCFENVSSHAVPRDVVLHFGLVTM